MGVITAMAQVLCAKYMPATGTKKALWYYIPILLGATYNKVDALGPYWELQTGHQYNKLPARNRRKAATLITLFTLPIIAIYYMEMNWLLFFKRMLRRGFAK